MKKKLSEQFMFMFLAFAWLYGLFKDHSQIYGDGGSRMGLLKDLIINHQISNSPYSMVMPLFSTIFWPLGRWFHFDPVRGPLYFNYFLFTIFLIRSYFLVSKIASPKMALDFLFLILFASMFPYHTFGYGAELFTAVFIALGVMELTLKNNILGYGLISLGVVNTPASIIGMGFLALWLLIKERKLVHFFAPAFAACLILLQNYIHRGSLFSNGYEGNHGVQTYMPYSGLSSFSYPFFFGIMSILFSFGKGIFFYIPGLIWTKKTIDMARSIPSNKLFRELLINCFMVLFGLVLVYSKWWAWYGGECWGPRFFLFGCILASLVMAFMIDKAVTLSEVVTCIAILGWSIWVCLESLLWADKGLNICRDNNYYLEPVCWYSPEFSPIFRPVIENGVPLNQKVTILIFILAFLFISAGLLKKLWPLLKNRVQSLDLR